MSRRAAPDLRGAASSPMDCVTPAKFWYALSAHSPIFGPLSPSPLPGISDAAGRAYRAPLLLARAPPSLNPTSLR